MIKNLEISNIHAESGDDVKKYAYKKIGKLDSYLPRHARKSAHGEISLQESKLKTRKQYTAEVILKLPGENLAAKETTVNMYAAIDIVEEKLKTQIKKYKEANFDKKGRRRQAVRVFLGKIVPTRR